MPVDNVPVRQELTGFAFKRFSGLHAAPHDANNNCDLMRIQVNMSTSTKVMLQNDSPPRLLARVREVTTDSTRDRRAGSVSTHILGTR